MRTLCTLHTWRLHIFGFDAVFRVPAAVLLQFAALVKKYQPHFYVNGHDHVMCYFNAKMYGYSTQFFTSGACVDVSTSIGVSAVAEVMSWQSAFKTWLWASRTAADDKNMACPAGAGSFTEPNDGGWNKTSGNVGT